MKDLLKEAIADAKAVRETALANAKLALEEAFTPRLQSMLSAKLAEEMTDNEEEMMEGEDEMPHEKAPAEEMPAAEEAPEEHHDEPEMEEEGYGPFTQEAQEICNKTWFSGGRVVVNKKTWYAHWHKGKNGKGYGFSNQQYRVHQADKENGRRFCIDFWMNNRWEKRTRDFAWFINHFWPIPSWTEDWQAQLNKFNAKE